MSSRRNINGDLEQYLKLFDMTESEFRTTKTSSPNYRKASTLILLYIRENGVFSAGYCYKKLGISVSRHLTAIKHFKQEIILKSKSKQV